MLSAWSMGMGGGDNERREYNERARYTRLQGARDRVVEYTGETYEEGINIGNEA